MLNLPHIFRTAPRPVVWSLLGLLALSLAACGKLAGDSWPGVSTNDGVVFVSYSSRLVALDATNGAVKWEYPEDGDAKFYAIPVVHNGLVFIGDWDGNMHAIDRETGQSKWVYKPDPGKLIGPISTKPKDRVISGAAVDDERVYFGLGSQNVMAISRETAEEVWTFKTGHGVWATPLLVPVNPDQPDSQRVLYVVSLDHNLYALDPATGDKIWQKDLGGAAAGGVTYDAERNRLYIGTFRSQVLAIDLGTRQVLDRFETDGWVWGTPALENDILYFGDLSGKVYAVRIVDGGFEQVWKQLVAESDIRSTPQLTEDLVIVGAKDHHVYALDKEQGTIVWNAELKSQVLSELVLVPGDETDEAHDRIVIGTESGDERAVALNLENGNIDWRYSR